MEVSFRLYYTPVPTASQYKPQRGEKACVGGENRTWTQRKEVIPRPGMTSFKGILSARIFACESRDNALYAEQHQIYRNEIAYGAQRCKREKRAEKHQKAETQPPYIEHERNVVAYGIVHKLPNVQTRQLGYAVCNEPYGQKHGQRPFADVGVGDKHRAAHNAYDARDKRERRTEARETGKPRIHHYVINAHRDRYDAVDNDRARQHAVGTDKCENTQ